MVFQDHYWQPRCPTKIPGSPTQALTRYARGIILAVLPERHIASDRFEFDSGHSASPT
jgi:hypothetical protein